MKLPPLFPFMLLTVAVLFAALPQAEAQRENRFLIVVDMSSGMRGRSNAVVQAVTELVNSKMKGEFRPGDTLGLWNYNERLYYDFPMQVWWETNKDTLLSNVTGYLRSQHYEKKARFEKTYPIVQSVMAQSRRLTTIFIFDGSAKITGTPFNDDINELHTSFYSELRKAKVPFVTAIATRNGIAVDYTVSSPGSIKLPHLADPYPPVATNTVAKVLTNAAPVTNAVVAAPPPTPRKYTEIVMSGVKTNASTLPPPVAAAVTTNAVATTTHSNEIVVTNVTAMPVSPPPTIVAVPSNSPPAIAALAVKPTNEIVLALPRPMTTNAVVTNETVANALTTNVILPTSPSATPPTTPAAVAAASETGIGSKEIALYVIAFSLLVIAGTLVWFLLRRSRGGSSSSLISQSLDRSR